MKSFEERAQREYERSQIIQYAVQSADLIIPEGSDGSDEETNYLTAEVARKLIERALYPISATMLRRDLED